MGALPVLKLYNKTCPACNTERGYSETLMLKGLDSFLAEVKDVIKTEDEKDEELLPRVAH